jgi:predicted SPOUT superfamily RNA methylase MTH1
MSSATADLAPKSDQKRQQPPTPAASVGGTSHSGIPAENEAQHVAGAVPARPSAGLRNAADEDEDDSDDEAAIARMKAQSAARAAAAAAEEDDFEVAAGGDEEEEEDTAADARKPPSDVEDDSDDGMGVTPRKPRAAAASAPVAAATPAKAAPAASAAVKTPAAAKSSPALKAVPTPKSKSAAIAAATPAKPAAAAAKPASAAKQPAMPKQVLAARAPTAPLVESSSESSDEEDEDPAIAAKAARATANPAVVKSKLAAAFTAPTTASASAATRSPALSAAGTPAARPAAAAAAKKPLPVKVVAGDSSESSDEESDDDGEGAAVAPAAIPSKKPQQPRKPTPLAGDASVNPPPKAPKPVKPASKPAAAAPAGPVSSFVQPLTRPTAGEHTGRAFTVTIALPGSIISNAQSRELRTYVAGQIARAAATFCVDEVVVFADQGKQHNANSTSGHFDGAVRSTDPDVFLARILQYLETPQYLRKQLFPMHADLAMASLLNPLDAPHHVRADEESAYREGVVAKRPVSVREGQEGGCWVNIGLKNEAFVPRSIAPGTRVTVHIPQVSGSTSRKSVAGRAVSSATPREKHGLYWGYTTRLASSIGAVWSECPYPGGYDLSIGTSERGEDIHAPEFGLKPFKHLVLFFGGLAGLEAALETDESLSTKGADALFDKYINVVVGQGCRTIRTEEAIPITLAALYRHVRANQPPTE